jgi:hypothetical protein
MKEKPVVFGDQTVFYLETPEHMIDQAPSGIAVVVGAVGFFPLYNQLTVDELNGCHLPDDVAEAALAGSMFGWDTPAAAPALAWIEHQQWLLDVAEEYGK